MARLKNYEIKMNNDDPSRSSTASLSSLTTVGFFPQGFHGFSINFRTSISARLAVE